MKTTLIRVLLFTTLVSGSTHYASATLSTNYPPSPDYQVVTLRTDCQSVDGCFENINEATEWAFSNSSSSTPKTLDIGPGIFAFDATNPICNGSGHVTIKGSGRDNTVISLTNKLHFIACPSIVVESLTIQRLNGGRSYETAVKWTDGGSSTWTNVLIDGPNLGWWDEGTVGGEHYWFSSVVRANNAGDPSINYYVYGYYSDSPADTWFYGGEIVANHNSGALLTRMSSVFAGSGAKIHMFGTAVRSIQTGTSMLGNATGFSFGSFGLVSHGDSEIHHHGGITNVASSSASDTCIAAAAYSGSKIHTPGSTFAMDCASNKNERLYTQDGSIIDAPHTWSAATTLPTNVSSITGQDMFIQTNCASSGCTNTGTQSHLLIYNSSCITAGPWFDVGLNKCRGD